MELIGKAPSNPSDQTVPNLVPAAPLCGTEPLAFFVSGGTVIDVLDSTTIE